jgi:hypothetical protein
VKDIGTLSQVLSRDRQLISSILLSLGILSILTTYRCVLGLTSTKLVHTSSLGFATLGILEGESYNGIRALVDLFMCHSNTQQLLNGYFMNEVYFSTGEVLNGHNMQASAMIGIVRCLQANVKQILCDVSMQRLLINVMTCRSSH